MNDTVISIKATTKINLKQGKCWVKKNQCAVHMCVCISIHQQVQCILFPKWLSNLSIFSSSSRNIMPPLLKNWLLSAIITLWAIYLHPAQPHLTIYPHIDCMTFFRCKNNYVTLSKTLKHFPCPLKDKHFYHDLQSLSMVQILSDFVYSCILWVLSQ